MQWSSTPEYLKLDPVSLDPGFSAVYHQLTQTLANSNLFLFPWAVWVSMVLYQQLHYFTFIFSMMEFVPSTLYFLSGFSLTCWFTHVVFPDPGNPTIIITYKSRTMCQNKVSFKKGSNKGIFSDVGHWKVQKNPLCTFKGISGGSSLSSSVTVTKDLPHTPF